MSTSSPLCLFALIAFVPALSAQLPTYRFKTLVIPNISVVSPGAIDAKGQVVGAYRDSSVTYRGFVFDGAKIRTVTHSGGRHTHLNGLNDKGVIVGSYRTTRSTSFTLVGNTFTTLRKFGVSGGPVAINNAGLMVGTYSDSRWRNHGFTYDGRTMKTIDFPGAQHTSVVDVDDQGVVLGNYWVFGSGRWRGFTYDGKTFKTFDKPGAHWTALAGFNNKGQMVGQQVDKSGRVRTAIYYDGKVFHDLKIPGATGWTHGIDINDSGVVCGSWQGTHNGVAGHHTFVAYPQTCQKDLGYGGPGNAKLTVCGEPLATGKRATLAIEGAPNNAPGFLGWSVRSVPTAIPPLGGTLAAWPLLDVTPIRADATGAYKVPSIPGGGDVTIYVQAVFADAAQTKGFAITNAVQVVFLK